MNKKKIVVYIIVIVLLIIIGFFAMKLTHKNNAQNLISLNAKEIANITETDAVINDFTIVVNGIYDGTITNLDISENNIKVYEFDAGIEYSWGVVTSHYVGIKVEDVLDSMGINDFNSINFVGAGNITVNYKKDEIDDKMYFILTRDGSKIGDANVNFLSVNNLYNYSIENLTRLTIL